MKYWLIPVIFAAFLVNLAIAQDKESESEEATFRVLGLFMEVRVEAFRKAIDQHEEIELVAIGYESGAATLRLRDPYRLKNRDPETRLRGLNERIRLGSRGAFELLPPHEKPLSERARIEIPIKGHDCLGCSFGAYRAIYKLEGVHRVTADFGEKRLVAWIDPAVTDREALEAELTKKKVLIPGKETD